MTFNPWLGILGNVQALSRDFFVCRTRSGVSQTAYVLLRNHLCIPTFKRNFTKILSGVDGETLKVLCVWIRDMWSSWVVHSKPIYRASTLQGYLGNGVGRAETRTSYYHAPSNPGYSLPTRHPHGGRGCPLLPSGPPTGCPARQTYRVRGIWCCMVSIFHGHCSFVWSDEITRNISHFPWMFSTKWKWNESKHERI